MHFRSEPRVVPVMPECSATVTWWRGLDTNRCNLPPTEPLEMDTVDTAYYVIADAAFAIFRSEPATWPEGVQLPIVKSPSRCRVRVWHFGTKVRITQNNFNIFLLFIYLFIFTQNILAHFCTKKPPIYAYQKILCILGFNLNNYKKILCIQALTWKRITKNTLFLSFKILCILSFNLVGMLDLITDTVIYNNEHNLTMLIFLFQIL